MIDFQTGDILLFRPTSLMGRLASLFTWSRYSHAALVSVENGTVYCLEVRQFLGGRKVELDEYLYDEPSEFEVWRLKEFPYRYFPETVVEKMNEFVGVRYGWFHAVNTVFLRFLRIYGSRECKRHPPFCSEAVSRAYRHAGLDLRPDIVDRFTLPVDLAKSPFLRRIS